MNRLVLIGNGFDLAHGLKTSYADFINWYKAHRVEMLADEHSNVSKEPLCTIELPRQRALSTYVSNVFQVNQDLSHEDFFDYIVQNTTELNISISPLFERIIKGMEAKTWGGIEQDYYELLKLTTLPHPGIAIPQDLTLTNLNEQLQYLQELLVTYLREISEPETGIHRDIKSAIYASINSEDVAIEGKERWTEYVISEMDKDKKSWNTKLLITG